MAGVRLGFAAGAAPYPARPVIPNGALADAAGSLGGMHRVEEDFGHEMTLQEKEHAVVMVVRQVVAGRRGRRR